MIAVAAFGAAAFVYVCAALVLGMMPKWMDRSPGNSRLGPMGLSRKRPLGQRTVNSQEILRRAGVHLSPARFAGVSVASGIVGATALYLALGIPLLALVGFGASAVAPAATAQRRAAAFQKERLAAWPDALRDVIAHLRAGHSVHTSLSRLAESGPIALRQPFDRYQSLSGVVDQIVALEVVREELADPASDRIIEVLLLAFDQGSSLVVDLLGDLAAGTADDLRLAEEIQTAQLETRLEARGAAALPFVVLAMLCFSSADYRAFYRTPLGSVIIIVGLALVGLGLTAIRRLGAMATEERMLCGGRQP